jgi:amino acid transporter
MTVSAAAALGVGSMVGAGIFALMGEAGTIAGSAVYLSFLAAGVIALASGYSMARLGARYPAAGGIVEYLAQAYGVGVISGALSILLYISAIVQDRYSGQRASVSLPSRPSCRPHRRSMRTSTP